MSDLPPTDPWIIMLCEQLFNGELTHTDFRIRLMRKIAGLDMDQNDAQTEILAQRILGETRVRNATRVLRADAQAIGIPVPPQRDLVSILRGIGVQERSVSQQSAPEERVPAVPGPDHWGIRRRR